jgi:hypothetical protein
MMALEESMVKKVARRIERDLKARGVYKPYVTEDNGHLYVESYPLHARIFAVFSTEEGPHHSITIYDDSLARLGENTKIDHTFTRFGVAPIQAAAELLKAHHPEAYARAKRQDSEALAS